MAQRRSAVTIRDYREADLAGCAAVFAAGTATALRRAPPDDAPLAFLEATRGEVVLVAEVEGRLAGFAAVFTPEAFVHHLYVDEACRGHGVGAALLAAAQARVGRRLALKCRLDNGPALAFYRRLGFSEVERGNDPDSGAWVRLAGPGNASGA